MTEPEDGQDYTPKPEQIADFLEGLRKLLLEAREFEIDVRRGLSSEYDEMSLHPRVAINGTASIHILINGGAKNEL